MQLRCNVQKNVTNWRLTEIVFFFAKIGKENPGKINVFSYIRKGRTALMAKKRPSIDAKPHCLPKPSKKKQAQTFSKENEQKEGHIAEKAFNNKTAELESRKQE